MYYPSLWKFLGSARSCQVPCIPKAAFHLYPLNYPPFPAAQWPWCISSFVEISCCIRTSSHWGQEAMRATEKGWRRCLKILELLEPNHELVDLDGPGGPPRLRPGQGPGPGRPARALTRGQAWGGEASVRPGRGRGGQWSHGGGEGSQQGHSQVSQYTVAMLQGSLELVPQWSSRVWLEIMKEAAQGLPKKANM